MTNREPSQVQAFSDDAEFKQLLVSVMPHLRAFARGLTGRIAQADDLVQETLLKAWAARQQFQRGTNFKAWCFVILRNSFSSAMRREKFSGDWDDSVAERMLSVSASQMNGLHLQDLQRALQELPTDQREAVLLIGASGMSYEEAAVICGCAIGTIKSRVSRARDALDRHITEGGMALSRQDLPAGNPLVTIMQDAERLASK
jgi:RNA polymerase sigma-70 factor, ECF subfamily